MHVQRKNWRLPLLTCLKYSIVQGKSTSSPEALIKRQCDAACDLYLLAETQDISQFLDPDMRVLHELLRLEVFFGSNAIWDPKLNDLLLSLL